MIEIFIDNKRIDLFTKDAIALTKQINDIAEIRKRQADYTNRFSIPKTPNNMAIAQMLNVPGNTSTLPYKWSVAKIVSNGIPITNKGQALIMETRDRANYDIIIYAGNYDLFSKIEGKYITDLDWEDLMHTFDMTNAYAAKDNTDGYIYPVADTLDGRLSVYQWWVIDMAYQVPHVFVKTIWGKIFAEAGIQFSGAFFDTADFKEEAVVADRNYYKGQAFTMDNLRAIRTTNDSFGSETAEDNPYYFDFDSDTEPTPSVNFNTTTNEYTAALGGEYNFTITIDHLSNYLWELIVQIKVNGDVVKEIVTEPHTRSFPFAVAGQVVADAKITLKEGDVVTLSYVCDNSNDTEGTSYPWGTITNVDYQVQQSSVKLFLYGSEIDFSNNLPKIKQVDFLKAIMQQFGLVYQPDENGVYQFMTIENILNGVAGFNDYTAKLHKETSESYSIGTYYRTNKFSYEYNDSDKLGDSYADSSFTIAIDNLQTEGDAVKSSIEACGDYLLFDSWEKIAATHSYKNSASDNETPVFDLQDNATLKTVRIQRRLVNDGSPKYTLRVYDNSGGFIATSLGGVNYPVAQFKMLHWSVLMETHYPKFILLAQKPVKKTVALWFTPIDIYFLDMFKIIYIEQYQSYFYLNKVSNFQAGKLTDCEIIKIN